MKAIQQQYIEVASDNLGDASLLFTHQSYKASVNRAYYCIFHCVEAFLYVLDVHAKTHEGVIRKFSELYIKTGILDKNWSDIFKNTFNKRQSADYDISMTLSQKEAQDVLEQAESFLGMTKQYFENLEKREDRQGEMKL
ncbi:MAG: HEPN domain-containing protein [Thermoflexibacter sp.]|jgi:uncharacterized protein (UPF0332 family)|nr:HEPN domain-containing protein [Thermoflexibacter sp.]